MFAKLLKHEFLATRKILAFTAIPLPIVGVLSLISYFVFNSFRLNVVLAILNLLFIGIASSVITIYLYFRYAQTMHGKAAYFTFSLPASSSQIFWAKNIYIYAIYLLFTAYSLAFLYVTALLVGKGSIYGFLSSISDQTITGTTFSFWLLALVFLLVYVFTDAVFLPCVITLGVIFFHRLGKVAGGFLMGVLAVIANSIIQVAALFIPGNVMIKPVQGLLTWSITWQSPITGNTDNPVIFPLWGALGNYVLFTAILAALTLKVLRRRLIVH